MKRLYVSLGGVCAKLIKGVTKFITLESRRFPARSMNGAYGIAGKQCQPAIKVVSIVAATVRVAEIDDCQSVFDVKAGGTGMGRSRIIEGEGRPLSRDVLMLRCARG